MLRIGIPALCLTAVSLIGCNRADPNLPPLVPVSGKVTLDGQPLSNAEITFVPVGNTPGDGAFGRSDPNGAYRVTYLRGGRPGTPAGEYRVTIGRRLMPDGKEVPTDMAGSVASPARETLPAKYSDRQRSTLTAKIPEKGSTEADFPLTSR